MGSRFQSLLRMLVGVVLLPGLAVLTGCGRPVGGEGAALPEVLPRPLLTIFGFTEAELPPGLSAVEDGELLERAGMVENPGFLLGKNDRIAQARTGGIVSLLGLYGDGEGARVVLNAIFFADPADAEVFGEVQASRNRPVAGFRRAVASGVWMVFVALDPEVEVTETAREDLRASLQRYAARLALEPMFDQLQGAQ